MEDEIDFNINPVVDELISQKFPAPNFGELVLNWLSPDLRKNLYNLISRPIQLHKDTSNHSSLKYFVDGVRAEYGIDSPQDISHSYSQYVKAAELNEPIALYKLYIISRSEHIKFSIERNKKLEMYNLLKAMAYLDGGVFFTNDTLYNIDIIYEIALHLDLEDQSLDKTNNLFIDLKYIINNDIELRFVEAMTLIKFNVNEDDILNGVAILKDLADNFGHVESMYKLACVYYRSLDKHVKKNTELALEYFSKCDVVNYTKCYNEFGSFLYNEENFPKAKEMLLKGIQLGNFKCIFLYYDICLATFDFFNDDILFMNVLLDYLVDDIITGNAFSFFEFFYLRRILLKHFPFKDKEEYNKIEKDLVWIIKANYDSKKLSNLNKDVVESEFMLSLGYIYYIGIAGEKNWIMSEELLKSSFKESKNHSYKRFCYSYIFKIRERSLCLNQEEKVSSSLKRPCPEEKLNKTKMKLFKIYFDSMDKGSLNDFSSSFYYFFAKLYEFGWGTKPDDLTAYCYYLHATKATMKYLGTGSIISYYRRYKSFKKLKSEKFQTLEKNIHDYTKEETSNDDEDALCIICFENPKNVTFFPCKHMTCKKCFDNFKETFKCPTCRGKIIIYK